MMAFIGGLSGWHLLVIGVVALLLFGNRLPEVARSLGRAFNEFKRGLRDTAVDDDSDDKSSDSGTSKRLSSDDSEAAGKKPSAETPPEERVPRDRAEGREPQDAAH
jgi:sec-independent protein translocase protein TatA